MMKTDWDCWDYTLLTKKSEEFEVVRVLCI